MVNERLKRHWCSWGLVAGILLCAAVIGALILHRGNHGQSVNEPFYQGKSLSEWLIGASSVPNDNDPGLSAIRAMGPPAVPPLLSAFRQGKLPSRVQRRGLEVAPWEVQEHAAEALKALGPEAAAAVPSLIECLKSDDKRIRSKASEILGKTGVATKPVRDALLSALNDSESAYPASRSLAALGRKETNVVYELMKLARNGKKPAGYWAACSLEQLGVKSKPALPVLIELIKNPAPDSDWEAVKALGLIGSEAVAAAPALVKVLEQGGPWARKCAAISLGRIGPAARESLPALRVRLEREDSDYTKADIARALWRIDSGEVQRVLPVARSIVEENFKLAATGGRISYGLMSALDLLGELGTNALTGLPIVRQAMELDDSHVQLCAAWAAWRIDSQQEPKATNVLWKLVDVENYPLEDFGKGPFAGLATMKRERESYHLRVAAVAMLWQIEPEARAKLKILLKRLLKEWNHWTGNIIPEEQDMAPVLQEFLNDEASKDMHTIAEEALDQVTGTKAERW